jgi:uncharacterized protein YxeA
MKRILIILLICMIILPVSASVETLKPAKLNQQYTIIQVCQDASYVNLSVSNLNGNVLVNKGMTLNGTQWEYQFTPTQVGRHDVTFISNGCSDDNGRAASYFEVTGSGFIDSLGFYFLILILSFGVILLGLYMQDATIVILGSLGLYFIGLYILFNGIDGLKDPTYTWAIGIIVLMLAAYISFKATSEFLTDLE